MGKKFMQNGRVKKRLDKLFSGPGIQRQLATVFCLVLVIPVLFCGFLLFQSARSLNEHYREQVESDNLRAKSVLFDVTLNLYNTAEDLVSDEKLTDILTRTYTDNQEFQSAVENYSVIKNLLSRDTSISSVNIYTMNETIGDYSYFHSVTDEIRGTDWFQTASQQASVFWKTVDHVDSMGNTCWELVLFRKIYLPREHSYAILSIAASENYLRSLIDNNSLECIMTVNQDPVFYSDTRSDLGQEMPVRIDYDKPLYSFSGQQMIGQKKVMTSVSTLVPMNSDDRMYIVSYSKTAVGEVHAVIRNYLVLIAAAILLPCLFFAIYSRYFSARVQTLRKAMHQASQGNYDIIDSFNGNDELSETFQDLRLTVEEIKEKEAQIYQARIREQEIVNQQQKMEFKMLASQINPHFLYNTLETIRMKAFTAGDREVANAIKLLGRSLRYVLENTGTAAVPLEKELNYIRTYVTIMKLRFGGRVNYEEKISQDIDTDRYLLLPLLLQPLVENAISHGLEGVDEGGRIIMEISLREGRLCIFVTDNGRGMKESELTELKEKIRTKDENRTRSFGLYNINQRLLLCYGPDCGLEIFSREGCGTTVGMRLPLEKLTEVQR